MTTEPERRTRRAERAAVRTAAKADIYLALYCSLGAERSLARVSQIANQAGVPISAGTLERYSSIYRWADRVREYDSVRAEASRYTAIDQAIANDVQHAQIGRALQELAVANVARHRAAGNGAPLLGGSDIARLAAEGVKIERLASGQATEIHSVVTQFYGMVITEVGAVWQQSMDAAEAVMAEAGVDENTRRRARRAAAQVYGDGADRALRQHLQAVGLGGITLIGPESAGE